MVLVEENKMRGEVVTRLKDLNRRELKVSLNNNDSKLQSNNKK